MEYVRRLPSGDVQLLNSTPSKKTPRRSLLPLPLHSTLSAVSGADTVVDATTTTSTDNTVAEKKRLTYSGVRYDGGCTIYTDEQRAALLIVADAVARKRQSLQGEDEIHVSHLEEANLRLVTENGSKAYYEHVCARVKRHLGNMSTLFQPSEYNYVVRTVLRLHFEQELHDLMKEGKSYLALCTFLYIWKAIGQELSLPTRSLTVPDDTLMIKLFLRGEFEEDSEIDQVTKESQEAEADIPYFVTRSRRFWHTQLQKLGCVGKSVCDSVLSTWNDPTIRDILEGKERDLAPTLKESYSVTTVRVEILMEDNMLREAEAVSYAANRLDLLEKVVAKTGNHQLILQLLIRSPPNVAAASSKTIAAAANAGQYLTALMLHLVLTKESKYLRMTLESVQNWMQPILSIPFPNSTSDDDVVSGAALRQIPSLVELSAWSWAASVDLTVHRNEVALKMMEYENVVSVDMCGVMAMALSVRILTSLWADLSTPLPVINPLLVSVFPSPLLRLKLIDDVVLPRHIIEAFSDPYTKGRWVGVNELQPMFFGLLCDLGKQSEYRVLLTTVNVRMKSECVSSPHAAEFWAVLESFVNLPRKEFLLHILKLAPNLASRWVAEEVARDIKLHPEDDYLDFISSCPGRARVLLDNWNEALSAKIRSIVLARDLAQNDFLQQLVTQACQLVKSSVLFPHVAATMVRYLCQVGTISEALAFLGAMLEYKNTLPNDMFEATGDVLAAARDANHPVSDLCDQLCHYFENNISWTRLPYNKLLTRLVLGGASEDQMRAMYRELPDDSPPAYTHWYAHGGYPSNFRHKQSKLVQRLTPLATATKKRHVLLPIADLLADDAADGPHSLLAKIGYDSDLVVQRVNSGRVRAAFKEMANVPSGKSGRYGKILSTIADLGPSCLAEVMEHYEEHKLKRALWSNVPQFVKDAVVKHKADVKAAKEAVAETAE